MTLCGILITYPSLYLLIRIWMCPIPKGFFEPLVKPSFTFLMYGTKKYKANCFSFRTPMIYIETKQNLYKKTTFDRDLSVFLVYMSWNGRIKPSKESQIATVMAFLSVTLHCEMCFLLWATIVMLSAAPNLDDVWSAFIIGWKNMIWPQSTKTW